MTNGTGLLDFVGIGSALTAAGFCAGLLVGRGSRRTRRRRHLVVPKSIAPEGAPPQTETSDDEPSSAHFNEYLDLQDSIREAYLGQEIGETEASISMIEAEHLAEIASNQDRATARRSSEAGS